MASQCCSTNTRPEPAAHLAAVVVGIWILLNAVALVYLISHADSPGVRQFLERLDTADAPAWPNYVD
jgi:hypothetical protein